MNTQTDFSFLPPKTILNDNDKELEGIEIYDYYDGPVLFSCKSGRIYYICLLISDDDTWLFVPMTKERFDLAVNNKIELRKICSEVEWYVVYIVKGLMSNARIEALISENITEFMLPAPGYYLTSP